MPKEEFELDVTREETSFAPRSKGRKRRSRTDAPWYYLGLIGEMGFAIALPIAGGALIGVVIDRTWGMTPKATLSLLFLGVIISFYTLLKTVETITKQK